MISGSFAEIAKIGLLIKELSSRGHIVFPTEEHFRKSPMVQHHRDGHVLTEQELKQCWERMQDYFRAIDDCNVLIIFNEKRGEEHYGTGAMIELGYALARGKQVWLYRQPTDENIRAMDLSMLRFDLI